MQILSELPLNGLEKVHGVALEVRDAAQGVEVRSTGKPVQLLLELRDLGIGRFLFLDGLGIEFKNVFL